MRVEPTAPAPWRGVSLAILAGGRGRRLGGVAKGLLRVGDQTALERLLELGSRFEEVLLVADDPSAYAGYNVRTVKDLVPDRGAPGGVQAALAACRTPWVVVAGCDMPFVNEAVVEALLEGREQGVEIVCFERQGRLEPLLAAYRTSLAKEFEARLQAAPSLQSLLRSRALKKLGEEQLERITGGQKALRSVNTPEDLDELGVKLPKGTNSSA